MNDNINKKLNEIYNYKIPDLYNLINIKDIVLYGAGSLGEMAINILNDMKIQIKYIVDKSKTGCLMGIKILNPEDIDIKDKYNYLFINCISTISRNDIEGYLKNLGCKNIIHFYNYAFLKFPDILSNGWFINEVSNKMKEEIYKVCIALSHDETSINHYIQFLYEKLNIKEFVNPNFPVLSKKKFFGSPCMPKLIDNEVLLDCGADFGQTIKSFLEITNNKFKNIYAFEPNSKSYNRLIDNYKDRRIIISNKVIHNINGIVSFREDIGGGLASKIFLGNNNFKQSISIDSLNINPTIIKLHIEGNELNALQGSIQTIKRCNPIIMVLADHNEDGLFKIPKFLYNLPNYKLYFNLHDYVGNSAVFYAIPKIRSFYEY